MTLFKEYKDIFGKPGEGFHEDRLLGMARNDLLGTLAIAIIFAFFVKPCDQFIKTSVNAFLILMVIATILHALFGVDTAIILFIKSFFY
jgi:hypothetical protein